MIDLNGIKEVMTKLADERDKLLKELPMEDRKKFENFNRRLIELAKNNDAKGIENLKKEYLND